MFLSIATHLPRSQVLKSAMRMEEIHAQLRSLVNRLTDTRLIENEEYEEQILKSSLRVQLSLDCERNGAISN